MIDGQHLTPDKGKRGRERDESATHYGATLQNTFNFMIFLGWDKWIPLRTSGFGNSLVRRTSRFFDEIRALDILVIFVQYIAACAGMCGCQCKGVCISFIRTHTSVGTKF